MASLIRLSIIFVLVAAVLIAAVLVGWADIGNRAELSALFTLIGLVCSMGLALNGILFPNGISSAKKRSNTQ